MGATEQAWRWGEVIGKAALSPAIVKKSRDLAMQFLRDQEAIEFSGHQIDTLEVPKEFGSADSWLPYPTLKDMGLELNKPLTSDNGMLVMTADADDHEDTHGPTIFVVLANDGLKFKQGRVKHKPEVGSLVIFDDLRTHSVESTKESTSLVIWSVRLKKAGQQGKS